MQVVPQIENVEIEAQNSAFFSLAVAEEAEAAAHSSAEQFVSTAIACSLVFTTRCSTQSATKVLISETIDQFGFYKQPDLQHFCCIAFAVSYQRAFIAVTLVRVAVRAAKHVYLFCKQQQSANGKFIDFRLNKRGRRALIMYFP